MIGIPVLKYNDQITKARQILRDDRFREVYVVDAKKNLLGYIDLTDGLRVTATKSNVTVEGYVKEAPMVSPADTIEKVARVMRDYETDSVAVVDPTSSYYRRCSPVRCISRHHLPPRTSRDRGISYDPRSDNCKSDRYRPEDLHYDHGKRVFRISRGEEEADNRDNFPTRPDPDTAGAVDNCRACTYNYRGSYVQKCGHHRS